MSDYDNPITRPVVQYVPARDEYERWRASGQVPSAAPPPRTIEELGNTPPGGLKHDDGKEPLNLLSRTWLLGVAKVMAFGAKKYAPHNWRKGLHRSRLVAAAFRHLLAYNACEDNDPETGLSHLDHASACLMFAREQHETHPELDDRYREEKK